MRAPGFCTIVFAALLAGAIGAFAPAHAADSSLEIGTSTVDDGQEAADQQEVEAAMADAGRGGLAAIAPHLDALKAVMAHAPAHYPLIERRHGRTLIHTDDMTEYLLLSTAVLAAAQKTNLNPGSVDMVPNTYATAALLLASYADEMKDYDGGDLWTARGLALQPHNWMLTLERASCMAARHRPADAVAVLQDTLDAGGFTLSEVARARLLRNKGSALIDLDRYDEAEAALNESIRLLPDNPQARNELEYLRRVRAGGPHTDVQLAIPPANSQEPTQAPAPGPSPAPDAKPHKG